VSASLRSIRGIAISSFYSILHFLSSIPLFAGRTRWISRHTGVDPREISLESCEDGFDLLEAAARVRRTIISPPKCGVCRGVNGVYVLVTRLQFSTEMVARNRLAFTFSVNLARVAHFAAAQRARSQRHLGSRHAMS